MGGGRIVECGRLSTVHSGCCVQAPVGQTIAVDFSQFSVSGADRVDLFDGDGPHDSGECGGQAAAHRSGHLVD